MMVMGRKQNFPYKEEQENTLVSIHYRKFLVEIVKWQNGILVKKRKITRCIYLPGSGFREAEGNLSMRSCLQDAVINSAPRIGKFINKQELYRQCPPRRVKDSHISEIENTSCVRNFMNVTPVLGIKK